MPATIRTYFMENEFTIREIGEKDIAAVGHLWFELSRLHEDFTPYYKIKHGAEHLLTEHVRDILKRGCIVFVAESDGEVCGFVSGYTVKRNPQLEVDLVGKVDNFFVSPDCRRKGMGTALLTRLIDFFKKQRIQFFEISCDLQNPDALRLYKKLGFVEQKVMLIRSES
jgi:ribosomal protein S18 acetylase RimI-like enzyme